MPRRGQAKPITLNEQHDGLAKAEKIAELKRQLAELEQDSDKAGTGTCTGDINIERFVGYVKSQVADKYLVHCQEVLAAFQQPARITWRSCAPTGLKLGDWISFFVTEEDEVGPGRGHPLAVEVQRIPKPAERAQWRPAAKNAPAKRTVKAAPVSATAAQTRASVNDAQQAHWKAKAGRKVAHPRMALKAELKASVRVSKADSPTEPHVTLKAQPKASATGKLWQASIGEKQASIGEKQASIGEKQASVGEKQASVGEKQASGLARSSAVARFKLAEARGEAFGSGQSRSAQAWKPAWEPPRKAAKPGPREPFQRVFLEMPEALSEVERASMLRRRRELQIVVEGQGGADFPPIEAFGDLEGVLPAYAVESLASNGISSPMPIQAQALPLVLAGHDLIGVARTGSGKTLAYMIPAVPHVSAQQPSRPRECKPLALVLAPTRELAVQIAEEARKLLAGSGHTSTVALRAVALFGGGSQNKQLQIQELRRGCQIVAATPGRLIDLMDMRVVSLERVTYLVLDEADRMLEEGFGDQVGRIVGEVRPDRQTLFFSATWPRDVQALAKEICQDRDALVHVRVGQSGSGATCRADIVQEVVVFDQPTWDERDEKKRQLLYAHVKEVLSDWRHKSLVFVSRKSLADELCQKLWDEGFKEVHAMHGGRSQDTRLAVLDSFKRSEYRLLVTTDVMGRGLDVPDVSHVVLFDMCEIDDYVHRIGRTARGPYGRGHALTFFEYDRKWPHLAGELAKLLQRAKQEVPGDVAALAAEVAAGTRPASWGKHAQGAW